MVQRQDLRRSGVHYIPLLQRATAQIQITSLPNVFPALIK
ncbi:unnamed protein product [Ixodes pacificus]